MKEEVLDQKFPWMRELHTHMVELVRRSGEGLVARIQTEVAALMTLFDENVAITGPMQLTHCLEDEIRVQGAKEDVVEIRWTFQRDKGTIRATAQYSIHHPSSFERCVLQVHIYLRKNEDSPWEVVQTLQYSGMMARCFLKVDECLAVHEEKLKRLRVKTRLFLSPIS